MATLAQLQGALGAAYAHYEIDAEPHVPSAPRSWANVGADSITYYHVRCIEERSDHTFRLHVHTAVKHTSGGVDAWFLDRVPEDRADTRARLLTWCESEWNKVISFQYNEETQSASVVAFDGPNLKLFAVAQISRGSYQSRDITNSSLARLVV